MAKFSVGETVGIRNPQEVDPRALARPRSKGVIIAGPFSTLELNSHRPRYAAKLAQMDPVSWRVIVFGQRSRSPDGAWIMLERTMIKLVGPEEESFLPPIEQPKPEEVA